MLLPGAVLLLGLSNKVPPLQDKERRMRGAWGREDGADGAWEELKKTSLWVGPGRCRLGEKGVCGGGCGGDGTRRGADLMHRVDGP